MVDTSSFGSAGTDLMDKVISGSILFIGLIVVAGIILGVGFYIRYLRQFNIKVEIKSLRGSGTMGEPIYKIVTDVGGFIENKQDKTRWFRLRGEKIDLPSPPLEAMQLDSTGKNHIKIFQKSDTEYFYLLPDKIDMATVVRNGETVPVAQLEMKVSDGDVTYWGQLRKRDNKKLFDMESMMMKLLPFIVPMLMFMLVIFMTYMITDHWGEFASAANALNNAAQALERTATATVITP